MYIYINICRNVSNFLITLLEAISKWYLSAHTINAYFVRPGLTERRDFPEYFSIVQRLHRKASNL